MVGGSALTTAIYFELAKLEGAGSQRMRAEPDREKGVVRMGVAG